MTHVTAQDLERLAAWDTPTICNALEMVVPDRRATGFTVRPMVCADPDLKPIVGWARTATIRCSVPSEAPADQQQRGRIAYYEYVADGARPAIAVIQDIDPEPGFGAFWGEVNTAVHKGLGVQGVVTNGSIRDLDACAPGFQLLAGMVGPSHAYVHVLETGCPVDVYGMRVEHDAIIHADRHGAVVIPQAAVKELPAAVDLLTRREAVILECARQPEFDIARLRRAMADARDIH
ncbi:MAG: RraA family protein [Rhodospirillales bacterium]|nr:RraA family protein [Rhodospirillales bacterium]MCY4004563.1 RraA family protein [Rhodospirillales bacterium]